MTVGERIKTYRLNRGWTQEELGKQLGVGKAAIQKYESGQVQNLKSTTIKTLCEIFNARPFDFIFDDFAEDKPEIIIHNSAYDELMKLLPKLNSAAYRKLIDYGSDLYEIPKYRK